MKIVNNRVVCSGCEEPFEVGQKMIGIQKKPAVVVDIREGGILDGEPLYKLDDAKNLIEIFHEGCD